MESMQGSANPQKKTLARRAGVALIWFFIIMIALTYVSRWVSERLKAKVETGYTLSASLDQSVEGTGTWAAGETQLYTTYFSRRVTMVCVAPGQSIAVGDPLFAYDVSTVKGGGEVSDKKLRAAKYALEKAEKAQDGAADPAYAETVVENARQALAYAEFTYAQYEAVQKGGVVLSTFSGVLIRCDLEVGKSSEPGGTGFLVAPDGAAFTMALEGEAAERVAVGDLVTLLVDGEEETEPLTIARIEPPDAEGRTAVVCQGDGGTERLLDAKQSYRIKKSSQKYNLCVPISALRQSGQDAYYVLVLGEKETILGTQLIAVKRAVKLLARDDRYAAVDGDLTAQDRLIVGSSKELKDGDSVVLPDA